VHRPRCDTTSPPPWHTAPHSCALSGVKLTTSNLHLSRFPSRLIGTIHRVCDPSCSGADISVYVCVSMSSSQVVSLTKELEEMRTATMSGAGQVDLMKRELDETRVRPYTA
jgi:hypothetical protein